MLYCPTQGEDGTSGLTICENFGSGSNKGVYYLIISWCAQDGHQRTLQCLCFAPPGSPSLPSLFALAILSVFLYHCYPCYPCLCLTQPVFLTLDPNRRSFLDYSFVLPWMLLFVTVIALLVLTTFCLIKSARGCPAPLSRCP